MDSHSQDSDDSRVKIIYKKKLVHEDHEEHLDERWLVSYSDMMTLLFGLFVMLYSMQEPESRKKMQESIQQRFTEKKDEKTPEQKINFEEEFKKAQIKNQKLKLEVAKIPPLTEELNKLKENLAKLLAVEDEKKKLEQEIALLKKENEEKKRDIASVKSNEDNEKKLLDENLKQKQEIKKIKEEISQKEKELEDAVKDIQQKELALRKVASKEDFKKEYLSEKEKRSELEIANKKLEEKLKTLEQKGSFLAVVLSWTTNEHDLDLVIKDPNGKKFNFKNKSFLNYPGKMVLDSRRGPGAEVWQAEKIIPGTYEAEVIFYNQYSNPAPAEGKIVIFSPKGNVEVPGIKLTLTGKNSQVVKFEITQDGQIIQK